MSNIFSSFCLFILQIASKKKIVAHHKNKLYSWVDFSVPVCVCVCLWLDCRRCFRRLTAQQREEKVRQSASYARCHFWARSWIFLLLFVCFIYVAKNLTQKIYKTVIYLNILLFWSCHTVWSYEFCICTAATWGPRIHSAVCIYLALNLLACRFYI